MDTMRPKDGHNNERLNPSADRKRRTAEEVLQFFATNVCKRSNQAKPSVMGIGPAGGSPHPPGGRGESPEAKFLAVALEA